MDIKEEDDLLGSSLQDENGRGKVQPVNKNRRKLKKLFTSETDVANMSSIKKFRLLMVTMTSINNAVRLIIREKCSYRHQTTEFWMRI